MSTGTRDSIVSPYFYGGPIKDPHDFFGREDQLRTICERLNKGGSTSIIGQRRSGKTSLFFHLMTDVAQRKYALNAQDFVFVYMNPQLGIKNPVGFYRELIEALAEQVPILAKYKSAEMNERVVRSVLKELDPRHVVILLDEFQDISSVGDFTNDFFQFLRGLDDYGVLYITATMENLFDCCPREVVSSPFAGIFATVYLDSWTEGEFTHFLEETSQRSGAPIVAYKDEIQKLAGRFPFYVQIACSFYFDAWRQRGKITAQDQASIKHRFADETRPHFEGMWKKYLTAPEKEALVALAHGKDCPGHPALHTLTQKGYVLDGRIFSSALTDFILHKEATGEKLLPEAPRASKKPVDRGIWLDKDAGDVWVDGKRIPPLTKLEYKLLVHLYDNANCICDKYSIVEAVWSSDYIDQVDDPRIAKLVSRLREDIEPDPNNSRYIVTVHGRGYKLVNENM